MLDTAVLDAVSVNIRNLPFDNQETKRETFDRSEAYALVAADFCLKDISRLCQVRISLQPRTEHMVFGPPKKVRLLVIAGSKPAIDLALSLYEMIDDMILNEARMFRRTHRDAGPKELSAYQLGLAEKTNARLKTIKEHGTWP